MRKRQMFLVGIMCLGLVGCQKKPAEPVSAISSEETQESSLERTLEDVLESSSEQKTELEPSTDATSEETTESVTEHSIVSEESLEPGWQETDKGKRYLIDDDWYYKSNIKMIDGKLYYFNDEGYLVLHGISPDGRKLGGDGEYVFEDLGLDEVSNKNQIDEALSDNYSAYVNGNMGLEFDFQASADTLWIDCGDYYKVENVALVVFTEQGDGNGLGNNELKKLDSICIRKDGVYIFDRECFTIDEWIDRFGYAPRWGVMFDEKGYIVSWRDAGVC